VSRYQRGKTNLDFTEARDSECQWHHLGHMQVCTSLQTDNHASTPPLSFLQAGCPSCRPTNSVKGYVYIITPPPREERNIVISVSVCACVCPRSIFGTTRPIFTTFFAHVTYGRGSVVHWRRSDTFRISGFMDDVIFAHKPRLLEVAAQLRRS